MNRHLTAAYSDYFPDPYTIQSRRKIICNEMLDLMIGQISHQPSFNMIVTGRIYTECPSLRKSDYPELTTDMFIHHYACNIIFEVVSKKRELALTIEHTSLEGMWGLVHRNVVTIARGNKFSISKLKSVLEQLVSDGQINSIINKYYGLKKRLDNDNDVANLIKFVEDLHTIIHGGRLLGGFKSCELCQPGELVEV
jgi:hypothetical protein